MKIWYLIIVVNGTPLPYHEMNFQSEAECEYVGKAFVQRVIEKKYNYSANFICWNSQKPPVRPMGGAQ